MTKQQEKNQLSQFRAFLNSQGYAVDPDDDLWMDEQMIGESFKSILSLFNTYQEWAFLQLITND